MSLLNSTFAQTIVIFITALFVFIVYFLNKRNEKREAAIILLDEIRVAELSIDEIRRNKSITELNAIMPINSWSKYIQVKLVDLMADDVINSKELYQTRKKILVEKAEKEDWLFKADRPVTNMLEYIANIQFITTATCGEKLRKISRMGLMYCLFNRNN